MTGTELMAVIGFAVMVFGAFFALWRYVESKISTAKDKADQVERDLAAHRLHTAETYITKAGMHEATQSIMIAIHAVKEAVDNMTARVDRIVDGQPQRRTRRTTED